MNYITHEEAMTIRESWLLLKQSHSDFPSMFYDKAFSLDPTVRPLFKNDMNHQGSKFVEYLDELIKHLDDWEGTSDKLREMGSMHRMDFGVKTEYYAVFASAFFHTLRSAFGSEWEGKIKMSWVNFYILLMDVMIQDKVELQQTINNINNNQIL